MMDALINAGGKGTRMGPTGIEKPMQLVGGKPTVLRVVEAMQGSSYTDRVLVSVSPNTPRTEEFLRDMGIETIRTSGDDFMMDLRDSFRTLDTRFVVVCPSDVPLITSRIIDECASRFDPNMESMVVMVEAAVVRSLGVTPSFACDVDGKEYVLSGLSFMERAPTIEGKYLGEMRLLSKCQRLAVNVNTPEELLLARGLFDEDCS